MRYINTPSFIHSFNVTTSFQDLTMSCTINNSDVILALGLSQEGSECPDSDFYSDPEFD